MPHWRPIDLLLAWIYEGIGTGCLRVSYALRDVARAYQACAHMLREGGRR